MPIKYKNYHPKWRLIRRLILKRAGEVRVGNEVIAEAFCEECGAINHHLHPVTGTLVRLTIAHVNRNRTVNRFWNLRAWCQRCHLRHDVRQRVYSFRYGRETQYVNGKLFK